MSILKAKMENKKFKRRSLSRSDEEVSNKLKTFALVCKTEIPTHNIDHEIQINEHLRDVI